MAIYRDCNMHCFVSNVTLTHFSRYFDEESALSSSMIALIVDALQRFKSGAALYCWMLRHIVQCIISVLQILQYRNKLSTFHNMTLIYFWIVEAHRWLVLISAEVTHAVTCVTCPNIQYLYTEIAAYRRWFISVAQKSPNYAICPSFQFYTYRSSGIM